MNAAGPAAEVVDSTDQLDTADTAVKTEYTAVAVDVVDDTTAAAGAYLQTDVHTASLYHIRAGGGGGHTSKQQSKLHLGVTRSVFLRKKGLLFILQPSRLNYMLLHDAIR